MVVDVVFKFFSHPAQSAEQLVDIPSHGEGLQGSSPGQGLQRTLEQIFNIPAGGGLHGFLPDPGGSRSFAVSREEGHGFFSDFSTGKQKPEVRRESWCGAAWGGQLMDAGGL